MKKFPRILAGAVIAMLALAAGAYAWHGGFSSASSTSATFLANTVANSSSQTCTAANNDAIQVSDATYTGTATSTDANLNGAITIDAKSVYDTTTSVGTVSGRVTIGSGSSGFEGRLVLVNAGGHLQGLLVGSETGGGTVLANVTSVFSTTAGFGVTGTPAQIGTGTGTDTAIVTTSSCTPTNHGHGGYDGDDDDNGGGGKFAGSGSFGAPFHTLGTFGFGRHGHRR